MMGERHYKVLKIILWMAVGLLVLVGGALLALQTDAGKAYVFDELTEQLNERLAGEVEVDRVSGPLLWGATLHDVEVRDARANDVLYAGEVEVTYSLLALLTGDFEFGRVRLEQPELFVRRYDDGTLNLATLTKPAPEPTPDVEPERERVSLPRFQISNGTIHYEDQSATEVNARGSLTVSTRGAVATTLDEIAFTFDAGPPNSRITKSRALQVEAEDVQFDATSDALDISAAQVVVDESSRIEDLRLTRTEVDESAGEAAKDSGASRFVGQVESLTITPRLAKLLSPGLELASPIEIRASFEGSPDDLEIEAVATVSEGGKLELDGTLDTSAPSVRFAFDARDFRPADWVEAAAPSMRLGAADGTIEARRVDSGAIEASVHLNASNVRSDEYRAKDIVLGNGKPFVITLGPPVDGGRRVEARGQVNAAGVTGADFGVDALDARAAVTAKSFEPGVPIGYEMEGTARGPAFGEHASGSANFDLTGTFVRAPAEAEKSIENVTAKGTVDVRDYKGGGLRISGLDTRIDLEHTPTGNVGEVRASLDRLVSNDRTYGSGRIDLDLGREGKFDLAVHAVPKIAPQFPLSLSTAGVHGEDFDVFDLSQFQVGRPGLEWKLRDQATIRRSEETVVIDSMVLIGPSQPISLDGSYPKEGAIAAIIERLGLASLEGLLQSDQLPEQLREQLPKNLEDLAPEELEKAIPDEVEEQLYDELRKRLPKF